MDQTSNDEAMFLSIEKRKKKPAKRTPFSEHGCAVSNPTVINKWVLEFVFMSLHVIIYRVMQIFSRSSRSSKMGWL